MKQYKISFLLSHPIQYFSPLFREMAKHPQIDLTVYYCSDESIRGVKDVGFGKEVKWDIPLLEGYKYKFLKNYSPKPTIFKPPYGLINLGIVREILNNDYDAMIVHGLNYITYLITFITAILRRTPIFIRAESPINQEMVKPRWKVTLKKLLLGSLFKRFAGFLAIGTENREFYKFYGVSDEKIFFTPYAIENERFMKNYEELLSKKDELKKEHGIPLDKVVILFSGKLIDKKRPMDLLMAYEKVSLENKALVYIGDGYLRRDLEEYVREKKLENVYFLGFKNQTELPKYYIMADIFVLPSSVGETWGLVVNEAMCFHLPVIVSDMVGCGSDLVKHGENGLIYPVGDIDKLADCLLRLLQDQALREKMGKLSIEIISKWSYKEDIEGILTALEYVRNIRQ